MPRVKGTSPGRSSADMAWASVKAARSCMESTRKVTVLGTHIWRLAVWMVVRTQSQTRQLWTCLRHNLTILIQNVMKSVSISLERRLLTCVDTIWPGVIRVATVGMVVHNARIVKSPDLTLMSVKAVMKMCFSEGPVISPDSTKPWDNYPLCSCTISAI